jgi:hypothetical protein
VKRTLFGNATSLVVGWDLLSTLPAPHPTSGDEVGLDSMAVDADLIVAAEESNFQTPVLSSCLVPETVA